MTAEKYSIIENYMKSCMQDSAHDKEHIYRVLYVALDIANTEENVDFDVIITASLLHDIGRKEQFENPQLCHAEVGAKKAMDFLNENGFDESFSQKVADCINSHRFRGNNPPTSIEAKILFDADKIDVTGTIGIARTLVYRGTVHEPLYSLDENGNVSDGSNDCTPSFFEHYKFKLEKLYSKFYTKRGNEIAMERQQSAVSFYENMFKEVLNSYTNGKNIINKHIT